MQSMQRLARGRAAAARTGARLLSAETGGGSKRFPVLRTSDTAQDLVRNPLFNKGTAFKMSERDRLGLRGLLPPKVLSMDAQLENEMANIRKLTDPLMKNLAIQELQDRNETLYHRMLIDNIMELAPIVYTPTVGKVCQVSADAAGCAPRPENIPRSVPPARCGCPRSLTLTLARNPGPTPRRFVPGRP
jgi:hypothetical protein